MKKCTIYLARHGQTDWNHQRRLQGQQDVSLNDEGVQQAHGLKEVLRGTSFAAIYASDLARARHTAEIVAGAHGADVLIHSSLRERYLAHHEGKPYPQSEDGWQFQGPDVETVNEVQERFATQLREIARHHSGENVLVVAHSGPIRFFLLHEGLFERGSAGLEATQKNGAYVVITCDGEKFGLAG